MKACTAILMAMPILAGPAPVLVELFTSEGCSSCPPADRLLIEAMKGVDGVPVIALGHHVDYWNRLGWPDPFSSAEATERQVDYARRFGKRGPYTPQMVVDGQWEFVGADERTLRKRIREAAAKPKVPVTLETVGGKATIGIDAEAVRGFDAWLAITEDGLVTHVKRGENEGRTLPHAAVVRSLKRLGGARPMTVDLPKEATAGRNVVVFVRDPRSGKVAGVGAAKLP